MNGRRLYSNLCAEFRRVMPQPQARLAAKGLAALIDGLWLRSALRGSAFNQSQALALTTEYITFQLRGRRRPEDNKEILCPVLACRSSIFMAPM